MLSLDVVNALKAFLGRVTLTGQEVPAYNKCMMQLAAVEHDIRIKAEQEQSAAAKAEASKE